MGEQIRRQQSIIEKASQALKKLEALGNDKKGEAHELWEQIESLEGQLRATFGPAVQRAAQGWLLVQPLPGASVPQGQVDRHDPMLLELARGSSN